MGLSRKPFREQLTMDKVKSVASEFMSHKRVAVVGVSRSPQNHGGNVVYQRLKERGFSVAAVNKNTDEIEGDVCYRALKSIPQVPEWVVLCTRPEASEEIMKECIELGVSRVWMHRGPGKGSVSENATRLGRENGVRVIDGGCPCMFDPAADTGHKMMRVVLGSMGRVPHKA
jgi:predicted CoA-binding protein